MPSFNTAFVTDKKLELEGVWHDIGQGVRIKIARIGTPEYTAYLRKLSQPHRTLASRLADDLMGLNEEDAQIFKDLEAAALSRYVLVDWDGFTETDEPHSPKVPYSETMAMEYIKKSDDFRRLVLDLGKSAAHFKTKRQEETLGNS